MNKYAKNTKVSSTASFTELYAILQKYGATKYGVDFEKQIIFFTMKNRNIRLQIPLLDKNQFKYTPSGKMRKDSIIQTAYEQGLKEQMRSLVLIVKAKLEGIEQGLLEFEDEFMSYFITPNGLTIGEQVKPIIDSPRFSSMLNETNPKD